MSPEYESWRELPGKVKEEVKKITTKKERSRIINSGFFLINCNGTYAVVEVEGSRDERFSEDELNFSIQSARESKGIYFVHGLNDSPISRRRQKSFRENWEPIVLEDADFSLRHSGSPYRGNHRSHVRGKGSDAFFRIFNRWRR
jgi:hypothetical protein